MKTLIVNHCDLDAVGCKIVLDYYDIPYDKMISVNYGDIKEDNKEIFEYERVVCVDFSLPTAIVKTLLNKGIFVDIYDHHDYTNDVATRDLFTLVDPKFLLFHDTKKCGTTIVAKEFRGKRRLTNCFNQFIKLVETYDLFKKEDPLWEEAQNCNRVLWGSIAWSKKDISKFDFICSFWLNKIRNNREWTWTEFEKEKISKAIDIENEEFSKAKTTYKEYFDKKNYKYGVAVASKKISIIASRLLKDHADIKYLIMFNTYGKQWGKLSLRSTTESGFDCTQFEECHGHKEASGGELTAREAVNLYKGLKYLTYKE